MSRKTFEELQQVPAYWQEQCLLLKDELKDRDERLAKLEAENAYLKEALGTYEGVAMKLLKLEAEIRQLIDERTKAEGEVLVERMKNAKLEAVAEAAKLAVDRVFFGTDSLPLREALRAAGYLEGQDRGE